MMTASLFRVGGRSDPGHRRIPFVVILVCVWAIPAILAIIETYTFARMAGRPFTIIAIVIRESATWVTYATLTPLMLRLADRLPLSSSGIGRRLSLHFLGRRLAMSGAV